MSVAFSLLALAVGLYAAGLICCAIGMAHPKSVAGRLTWALLPLACLVHLLSFLTQWYEQALFPLHTLLGAFSLYALLTFAGAIWFGARRDSLAAAFSLGSIPFACLVLVFLLRFHGVPLKGELPPLFLSVHLFVVMVAFSAFSLAAGAGALLLWQEKALKRKRFGPFWDAMPPLEALDRETYGAILAGVCFLTFGILQGILGAPRAWGEHWYHDKRLVSSLAVWAVYGVYLCARARYGWRGRKLALFAVAGFVLTLITFVLINMGKVIFG